MDEWGCRCRFSIPCTFLSRETCDGCCRLGAAAALIVRDVSSCLVAPLFRHPFSLLLILLLLLLGSFNAFCICDL
jgi:hypothetical protein